MDLPSQLQELLPDAYSYILKDWTPSKNEPSHFEAKMLVNVYTEEEAQKWWQEFNIKSNTTMRVKATCPNTGRINLFKIYLRCLHQGRTEKIKNHDHSLKSKSASLLKRNTNCPAGMIVAIRRVIKYSHSKMRDPVDPVHPCEIQIRFIHNHPTDIVESLRFRPVSKEAEEKLLSLFKIGHSPISALETLKTDLQIEHGSLFSEIICDRYHCPDISFCYRLYYKYFDKDFAASAKTDICSNLASIVAKYNSHYSEACLAFEICDNGEYVVVACTPLMRRAHTLFQSGGIVYVESFESQCNKDRAEHHILLLKAHTPAGGVPLGAILATSNNTNVITQGFQLLKHLLPDEAFSGRGLTGPHAFLIEDLDYQKQTLNNVWPDSDVIICIFRILQSVWRWLWNEKNVVQKDHRLYLLYLVKTVIFASSDSEMADKYQALWADDIVALYPMYSQKIESLWQKRLSWGLCYHRLLPLQDASSYYEAAARALKDKSLDKTKTFNIIQIMDYLVTRFDNYYKTKLLDIFQGKNNYIFLKTFPNAIPTSIVHNIKHVTGNYFIIPNENGDKFYTVDPELNICSCPDGMYGSLCSHQYWAFLKVPSNIFKADVSDANFRQKLFWVSTASLYTNIDCCKNYSESLIQSKSSLVTSVPSQSLNSTCADFSETTQSSLNLDSTLDSTTSNLLQNTSAHRTAELMSNDFNGIEDENQNSDVEVRMAKVIEKFEDFYKRVKNGLKNQPEEFLPALEIMMKNVERKGNSDDHILSGLKFFGIISVPSLVKKRKRKLSSTIPNEELIPKVYGRQMITYGKKKSMVQIKSESQPISATSVPNPNLSLKQLNSSVIEDR